MAADIQMNLKSFGRLGVEATPPPTLEESVGDAVAAKLFPWVLGVAVLAVGYRIYSGKWFGWS